MKLTTRLGVFFTASLLACGSLDVAHATVDDVPPTESTTMSPDATPTPVGGSSMSCTPDVTETAVTILLQTTADFTDVTVTAAGQSVAFERNGSTDVIVDRTDATEALQVELWDDNGQRADACVVAAQPRPSPPTDEPEPSEPSAPETDEPPETTEPEPEPTEPEPTSPAPTLPLPSSPAPSPSWPQQPSQPPAPTPTGQNQQLPTTSSAPAPRDDREQQFEAPTTSSDQPHNRQIRRYSDSPRYLLPQFFGLDSHRGSPLIMPHPRDGEQQPSSFETLPPISEDELDAIKAQLSSPGRADQSTTTDEVQGAEIDDRLGSENSWWLLAGITGVVCVGAGAWWALSKRKRRH